MSISFLDNVKIDLFKNSFDNTRKKDYDSKFEIMNL